VIQESLTNASRTCPLVLGMKIAKIATIAKTQLPNGK
jgi:hypothetical protein